MTILNLPIDDSPVELSNDGDEHIKWKRILPLNKTISYGGKKLTFSKDLMERLKSNYESGILDQTAFQLATDSNSHDTLDDIANRRNFDPERYRGEIQELKIVEKGNPEKDGFWAKMKLTDEGLKLIKDNPNLGVSPSIKPSYVDADGKSHDFVLRHVVGTLDPKVKQMGAWHDGEILLTSENDNEEVFGLTAPTDVKPADTDTPPTGDTVSVSRTEYDKMKADLAELEKGEALLDEILAEEDDDVEVKLSADRDPKLVALENKVAKSEWKAEKNDYLHAGVPAPLLNLCDEVMEVADDFTINLSNGESADPRDVIRKLLDEAKGYVDLTNEQGHGQEPKESEAKQKEASEFVDGFINTYTNPIF